MRLISPFCQRAFRHLRHPLIGAGDHNLRFRVQIGDIRSGAFQQRFNLRQGQPHYRGQAITVRIGLLHEIATQRDQLQRVGKFQRSGNDRGRIRANRQTADDIRCHAALFKLTRPGNTGN